MIMTMIIKWLRPGPPPRSYAHVSTMHRGYLQQLRPWFWQESKTPAGTENPNAKLYAILRKTGHKCRSDTTPRNSTLPLRNIADTNEMEQITQECAPKKALPTLQLFLFKFMRVWEVSPNEEIRNVKGCCIFLFTGCLHFNEKKQGLCWCCAGLAWASLSQNHLSKEFNWPGKGTKRGFSQLALVQVVRSECLVPLFQGVTIQAFHFKSVPTFEHCSSSTPPPHLPPFAPTVFFFLARIEKRPINVPNVY